MALYPTYAVRNPWVNLTTTNISQYFPMSHEGLEAAIEYCRKHKLAAVVFLKSSRDVEVVWPNPRFGRPCCDFVSADGAGECVLPPGHSGDHNYQLVK